ncbi:MULTISPECIES: hypothetical protein [Halobacillus]|uniref:Antitoxin VbhA domain-containing protein n=1 Tax=Halobacillus andaensis TaxID=1176239 RepID=A0A917B2T3_HALAA|nr:MULTISPECIES: hypothetical protein [Halobacillus]MBP2004678.1 hypothetical protein [Halobacillus andaensis]MCP3027307.1 hypothetical protein [Halobacillus sp. A5]GGF19794.1 hypothetical protein GCM10010954_18200 [Halobacillus andaensis]
MSVRTDEQAESLMQSAKASMAIEGLDLSQREESLVKKCLTGSITHKEFLKRALELSRHA